jgi:hypothetical protein
MSGFEYFVLGLLISIPVAVLSPFLTQRLQQRLGERTSKQAARRRAQLTAERAIVEHFVSDQGEFTHFLLNRILLITLVTSFTALVPGLISTVAQGLTAYSQSNKIYSRLLYTAPQWLFTVAAFIGVISAIIVIQLAGRSIRMYRRVSDNENYFKFVDSELSRLHGQGGSMVPDAGPGSHTHEKDAS